MLVKKDYTGFHIFDVPTNTVYSFDKYSKVLTKQSRATSFIGFVEKPIISILISNGGIELAEIDRNGNVESTRMLTHDEFNVLIAEGKEFSVKISHSSPSCVQYILAK